MLSMIVLYCATRLARVACDPASAVGAVGAPKVAGVLPAVPPRVTAASVDDAVSLLVLVITSLFDASRLAVTPAGARPALRSARDVVAVKVKVTAVPPPAGVTASVVPDAKETPSTRSAAVPVIAAADVVLDLAE